MWFLDELSPIPAVTLRGALIDVKLRSSNPAQPSTQGVSSVNRSGCQESAEAGVKHQPKSSQNAHPVGALTSAPRMRVWPTG